MIDIGFDKKAFTETYMLLKQLPEKQFNKIPNELIDAIKFNMDKEYYIDNTSIESGELLPDTEKILATIYSNYLSTSEEKIVINKLININEINKKKKYKSE